MNVYYQVRHHGEVVDTHEELSKAIEHFTTLLGRKDSEAVDHNVLDVVGNFVETEGRFVWGDHSIRRVSK